SPAGWPVPAALSAAALVVLGGMYADAQGFLHKRWTPAIVWNAPDDVGQEIRDCKDRDWPCLFAVMARHHAPSESVAFMRMVHGQDPTFDMGYPVAFHGDGRVKAVEVALPRQGMGELTAFVFVNGSQTLATMAEN